MSNIHTLSEEVIQLLKKLIATPSYSKEEDNTADILNDFLELKKIKTYQLKNNLWALSNHWDVSKPTILLNSHHDTVKPNKNYTLNPFEPIIKDGKLFGLGSNDAGGCLVSLLACFIYFYNQENLPFNLVFAASAEEEISGYNGIELVLPKLPQIDFGIVGEPTEMEMAIAEKGLLVIDVEATGVVGHAAREEGENAFYKLLPDILWFKNFKFDRISDVLGACKMTITSIETSNKAHNVTPADCKMVVDIRLNELYTFEEILEIIQHNTSNPFNPRSLRMRSTSISVQHPIIQAGIEIGKTYFGSSTTSDKALMTFPTVKMGPGFSGRSHTADEFIFLHEIEQGIKDYITLLETYSKNILQK